MVESQDVKSSFVDNNDSNSDNLDNQSAEHSTLETLLPPSNSSSSLHESTSNSIMIQSGDNNHRVCNNGNREESSAGQNQIHRNNSSDNNNATDLSGTEGIEMGSNSFAMSAIMSESFSSATASPTTTFPTPIATINAGTSAKPTAIEESLTTRRMTRKALVPTQNGKVKSGCSSNTHSSSGNRRSNHHHNKKRSTNSSGFSLKPSADQLKLRKQTPAMASSTSSSLSLSHSPRVGTAVTDSIATVTPIASTTAASASTSTLPMMHHDRNQISHNEKNSLRSTNPQTKYSSRNGISTKTSTIIPQKPPTNAPMSTQVTPRKPIGWNPVETKVGMAPCQRSLHTSSVVNGSLYIFGGYDGQSRINDFHCFSFTDKTWTPVISSNPERTPSPRDRHVSVVYQNSLYIFGGFDGSARVNDFFQFDFNTMSWIEIFSNNGTVPPSPRHSHSAVVYKDSLYVFGGYDGSYRSDFHQFHFPTRSWTVVPSNGRPPRARYRATCVVHEKSGTMLLFGGHDGSRHLADTHVFDFELKVWLTLQTEGIYPIPRDSHVSVVYQDSMFVFGGSTGSAMNDLYELKLMMDESTMTLNCAKWNSVVGTTSFGSPGHRFCHSAAVYGSSIYVFGGYDGLNRLNDFVKFDFGVDDLTFPIPDSTLLSDLRSMVNNEAMCDVTLIVEGRHVCAHKLLLTRCPYFQAMFMGEMMESSQKTITLEEVRYPIFLSILEYLYTDMIDIELEDAMEIFIAADQFCIPRLKTICEKKLLESITIHSAANLLLLADMHSAHDLKAKTLKFILAHFDCVSKTSSFAEMARENVDLAIDILKNR